MNPPHGIRGEGDEKSVKNASSACETYAIAITPAGKGGTALALGWNFLNCVKLYFKQVHY